MARPPRLERPLGDQLLPNLHAKLVVDLQEIDGNAADGRSPEKVRTLPSEMRCPFVAAGVEERRKLSSDGIDAADIRPLKGIAEDANRLHLKFSIVDPRCESS